METVESRQYKTDLASYGLFSSLSQTPQTPPVGSPLPYQDSHKRTNHPLADLIETEQKYVEDLKCLLQQVTASWSSESLPPPELDSMFRYTETVYKKNKKFYSKLNKIGSNSASTKDLDEVLLTWIDDMNNPYTKYVENFKSGFDLMPEIEENLNLQQTLNDISAERNQPVSLDYFFDMPLKRLHYYKKLYTRLYKNTEPGCSDNSLLLTANEQIDRLLELEKKVKISNKIKESSAAILSVDEEVVSSSATILQAAEEVVPPSTAILPADEEIVSSTTTILPAAEEIVSSTTTILPTAEKVVPPTVVSPIAKDVSSVIISPTIEVHQAEDYEEQDNVATQPIVSSPVDSDIASTNEVFLKKDWTLEELESQLDTSKTKDLFTKLPKIVKISLRSTDLPFERKIILHNDFVIETTKSVNSSETIYINAYIFLLTDSLLICRQITQKEKQESSLEKDLELIFPPLSTNHITINDVSDNQEDSLELTILQKEMLVLYANDKDIKNNWLKKISKAIGSSSNAQSKIINKISKAIGSSSNAQSKIINKAENGLRISTLSTLSNSPDGLRSPSVGNLVNRGRSVSSVSRSSSLFPSMNKDLPDLPVIRSRTPDPPQNAGGKYPGDYLPSQQGIGQERHNSDPISSPGLRNKLTVGLQTERSNSMVSLASVMSIASFKETVFRSSACEVFIWVNGEWKPLTKKDNCIVEVRLTVQNKGCWAILLESSNRMVLNAWVHSTTTLHREGANSVSISCEIGQRKEYYKINTSDSAESDQFFNNLLKIKESAVELNAPRDGYASRSSSLQRIEPLREIEQTVTQVMEDRCRVFLQNDHGVWTNIGWGNMKLLVETPSHRKRIIVNADKKTKTIIDAIVSEGGVERIGKSVAITLNNMGNNLRIVYLLKMKDEASAVKVLDIIKEKRKN